MRSLRRPLALIAASLALAVSPLVTVPAAADPPEVALSVSPATAYPGDTIDVTVTVTNIHGFTVLNAAARLFAADPRITSFTTLTGCSAPGSCGTVSDGQGPLGYSASLGALGGGQSATAVFTLAVDAAAPAGEYVLRGDLTGSNYGSEIVTGPTLTVVTEADAAVALTATPRLGLLVPKIEFTVRLTGNGPGTVSAATVTTTLPSGLGATSSACATGSGTVSCAFANLPQGASATKKFSVPIGLLTIGVPYTFTATRTASTPADPVSGNDVATVRCTVVSIVLVNCA
ncbi:DUF11 domain-containing protein [Sphaerisporangium rubeum]|uniref:DUF11 domain-containing protein n=1 Tax=Sphaerisporangium rubeum TaxID=321317 RepID=A0A7X0M5K6_9ACTN|nr:DUF11 domain-containing protein [Sphaerisporangium rubeum]MBB6472460.1 hypothetical protein [Sphaerisporangium rubeum]